MPEIVWVSPPKYDQQILNEIQLLISSYETKFKPNESHFNERSTGQGLIEPLLETLGWNTRDIDEVYPEYYVTGSGRVDYVLKINRIPVIYLEIKKLSESLDGVQGGKYYKDQAMDYAWKKRATWAVLTNFKELRLYNAKERLPIFRIPYQEYTTKFEGTLHYLTKDATVKGEIGQLYALKAGKEIDEDFLQDLQKWRLNLANDVHKNNILTIEQISSQTQKILNRLILIRIAEDRGALPRGQLKNEYMKWRNTTRSRRKRFIEELKELFLDFEFDFNTELFKSDLCDSLTIGDSVFEDLIENLYEYDFSTLTGDILGSTYELYLGYSLEPINKDFAEYETVPQNIPLELVIKREYRQREGIFYTRPPVVDFIVSKTVFPMIKSGSIEELKNLKILDASGGSGSFLIKAMIAIRNHLLTEVLRARKELVHSSPINAELASMAIDDIPKFVLQNNPYLVDLDPQAVEIAKVNLWAQALHPKYGKEKVLLVLDEKFKCGNSLVSVERTDLLRFFANDVIDTKIRPFNWKKEFPEVFSSNKAFDVIIGNPPYYSVHFLDDAMKDFLETYYSDIHTGQNDILYYFYHKGIELLREHGLLGFITARYFLEARDATKLRTWILDNCKIKTIVDFGNIDMFGGLGTRTAVVILEKCTGLANNVEREANIIEVAKVKCRRWMKTKRQLMTLIEQHLSPKEGLYEDASVKTFNIKQSDLSSNTWVLVSNQEEALKRKIESKSVPLESLCHCGKGMETGLNEALKNGKRLGVFHLNKKEVEELKIEPETLQKLVKNSDIDRYLVDYKELYLLYLTDEHDITKFPNAESHLSRFKTELLQRYGFERGSRKWYAISVPRNKELFDNAKEKLICPYISPENRFAYDNCTENQKFYGMTDTTIIVPKEDCNVDLKFILAVLNSTTSNFYYRTFAKPKDYRYEYFSDTISKICIPDLSKIGTNSRTLHDELVKIASEMIQLRSQQNSIRKSFLKVLKDNIVNTTCVFKDYYQNALTYSFQKSVLLDQDVDVQSSVIQLSQDDNSIFLRAYFDDEWHNVLKMTFKDQDMRDFIYLAIDNFITQRETSVAWRKGRIIENVILGIEIPRLETNHEENRKRIHMIISELRSVTGTSDLGKITERTRTLDKQVNEIIYSLYDLDENEKRIIENSTDYQRPYLRY